MNRKHFILIFLLLLSLLMNAAPSEVRHLLINNGLSNNYIRAIQQDGKGLVWIATESGLNSYDGYSSINYNSSNSGLNANLVNTIFRHNGKIWIGTNGRNICSLDESSNVISEVKMTGIEISNVLAFSQASDGGIWMMSRNKIVHYSDKTGNARTLFSSNSRNVFRCMVDNGRGSLVVGNFYYGISTIDTRTGRITKVSDSGNTIDGVTADILCRDKRNNVWIGTNSGLYRLDSTGKLSLFSAFGNGYIRSIQVVKDGEVWVSTDEVIKSINLSNYEVSEVSNVQRVQYIYEDPHKNIWMGTRGFGVYLMVHRPANFKTLTDEFAQSITHIGDKIFVGGDGKVMMLLNNSLVRTYPVNLGSFSGSILSINHIEDSDLILAFAGKTLLLNIASGKVSEVTYQGKSVSAITFYYDHETRKMWISANDGIFSLADGKVTKESKLNKVLENQSVTSIRRDWQGKLWVSTYDNGMFIFSQQGNLLRHLSQQNGFFSNSIQHLYADRKGRIWMCTPDGLGYVPNTVQVDEVEIFGPSQGLHDPFIRAITEDKDDNLWIATNNSISVLNLNSHSFQYFDNNDIPMSNFSGGLIVLPNDNMYVTSVEGVLAFDASSLTLSQPTSQVNILDCFALYSDADRVNERRLLMDDGSFELHRNENSFRIVFGVNDLSQSKQVEYAYRVSGLNDEWTVINENTITFRDLSSGTYRVQIRARMHGQDWKNATVAEISIYVPGPLWLSWPAKLLYAILIATLVSYLLRRYQKHLKLVSDLDLEHRQKLAEEERNTERLQFFTNITHELRTPLTLIFGPIEELEKSNSLSIEDHQKVTLLHGSANRLLNLINQIMDFRKAETNNKKLKIRKGNLQAVVEKIGSDFSQANRNSNVEYLMHIDTAAPEIYFDEEVMTSILTNLLSNSMKYTSKGTISIDMDQTETDGSAYTRIQVKDTGSGIAKNDLPHIFKRYYQSEGAHQASGTGIGLALVKALCDLHKIHLEVESKEDEGTEFTLLLNNAETYPEAEIMDNKLSQSASLSVSSEALNPVEGGQPVVLVVEDNVEINNYIAQNLSSDYIVIQASNGEEGWKAAKSNIPDLIICDIMMPVMDGITMTKYVKEDMMTSHIPVIMLTAKTTVDDRQEGYESGADSYLTKPFSITMLKIRIRNLLESRQRMARYVVGHMGGKNIHGEQEQNSHSKVNLENESDQIPQLSKLDAQFLEKLNDIITRNIRNDKLNLVLVSNEMSISQSTLYRKVKALTGITTNEFIRKKRLHHAEKLMTEQMRNISEAAYDSGFSDLAYFRQAFRQEFGTSPSEYLRQM